MSIKTSGLKSLGFSNTYLLNLFGITIQSGSFFTQCVIFSGDHKLHVSLSQCNASNRKHHFFHFLLIPLFFICETYYFPPVAWTTQCGPWMWHKSLVWWIGEDSKNVTRVTRPLVTRVTDIFKLCQCNKICKIYKTVWPTKMILSIFIVKVANTCIRWCQMVECNQKGIIICTKFEMKNAGKIVIMDVKYIDHAQLIHLWLSIMMHSRHPKTWILRWMSLYMFGNYLVHYLKVGNVCLQQVRQTIHLLYQLGQGEVGLQWILQ